MKNSMKIFAVLAASLLAGSASAADAKANWTTHCTKCHGADGKGGTRMGKQAGAKDYTDAKVQEAMKDDAAAKAIKEGITEGGKKKMDPYGEKLNEEDIKALIAYMRTFKK